jgi:hypothetical protein
MLRTISVSVAAVLALLSIEQRRTQGAEATGDVKIVLDCSQRMAEALGGAEGVASRFEAARDVVEQALKHLEGSPDNRVGLVLLGHRLAWEGQEAPGILQQDAYLEPFLGYEALRDTTPDTDVEIVRHAAPLEEGDVAQLRHRLSFVQPWGGSPLCLSAVLAMQDLRRSATSDRRVILITDGAAEPTITESGTDLERVEETFARSRAKITVIVLGSPDVQGREVSALLRGIAQRTRGDLVRAESPEELARCLEDAIWSQPAAPATSALPTGVGVPASFPEAVRNALADLPKHDVIGFVFFDGECVPGADVRLSMASVDANPDAGIALMETTTNDKGEFTFRGVPKGLYTVDVEGIARNRYRYGAKQVLVEDDSVTPPEVEVNIEARLPKKD